MELVILSGKGGTGKTTISLAFSEMLRDITMVDCDVDAPNLNLFYNGNLALQEEFSGEKKAYVDSQRCNECGLCTEKCKFQAIEDGSVNLDKCEGCGVCKIVCPEKAVEIRDIKNADIFVERGNEKDIVRADMRIGSEGSGKLVTRLRKVAGQNTSNNINIIDGSPGIGCQVLASCTNCRLALIVSEPSMSGLSDFKRIYETVKGLNVETVACINKYDLNEDILEEIKRYCTENKIDIVGLIPFDSTVSSAINSCRAITEYEDSIAAAEIRKMWRNISEKLKSGINKIKIN